MRFFMKRVLQLSCLFTLCLYPTLQIMSDESTVMVEDGTYTPLSILTSSAPYIFPQLPYSTSALEPTIDKETMELHWGKHHRTYVDQLNNAYALYPQYAGVSLEKIFQVPLNELPAALRNNGGGHWNHSFFWLCLTGNKQQQVMPVELQALIQTSFGSIDNFKAEIEKAGLSRFGSGWVWVVQTKDGKLAVTSTLNQDNPLMNFSDYKGSVSDIPTIGKPVLCIDLWEHAYYLHYHNLRKEYLNKIWNVINWSFVATQIEPITSHP